jgi:two-component system phosphate regulon response regulator PhoB
MATILLLEDAPDSQALVRRALEEVGEVKVAGDLKCANALLEKNKFDLLIVDVQLPDGDGFGFCSTVLTAPGAHRPKILFLTGNGELSAKLTGFSVGADDYLVKPVDPLELRARVIAQLRSREEAATKASIVRKGNLRLNLSTHSAAMIEDGIEKPIDLTPTEFKLLFQLARYEGRIFSREQLLQSLKGGAVHVTDRTIDAHLCRIRKKLAECTHSPEPIYGVGYRLVRKNAE